MLAILTIINIFTPWYARTDRRYFLMITYDDSIIIVCLYMAMFLEYRDHVKHIIFLINIICKNPLMITSCAIFYIIFSPLRLLLVVVLLPVISLSISKSISCLLICGVITCLWCWGIIIYSWYLLIITIVWLLILIVHIVPLLLSGATRCATCKQGKKIDYC